MRHDPLLKRRGFLLKKIFWKILYLLETNFMNRSFSKIRHIQEVNRKLEGRLLNEQPYGQKPAVTGRRGGIAKPITSNTPMTVKTSTTPPQQSGKTKDNITYTVQQIPSGKFKIFVTTPTVKTPTDAFTVFKGGTMWKEYNTQDEAQKAIDSIVNTSETTPTGQPVE